MSRSRKEELIESLKKLRLFDQGGTDRFNKTVESLNKLPEEKFTNDMSLSKIIFFKVICKHPSVMMDPHNNELKEFCLSIKKAALLKDLTRPRRR